MDVYKEIATVDIILSRLNFILNHITDLNDNINTNQVNIKLTESKFWLEDYKNHLNSFLQGSN